MTFDVNALLTKIEANVVPELPDELKEEKLREHVAQRIAVASVIVNDQMKLKFIVSCLRGAEDYIETLMGHSRYFARVSGKKFGTFTPAHQDAMELTSMRVTRSTCVLRTYTATLLKMQEIVQSRIDLQK
jgi:hypothetical protein